MLTSLKLTNFQKHADLEIAFSDGLNLVVGKNWAGKTTVQRAILYALFGTSAVPVKAGNLVRLSESAMEVQLDFRLGRLYTVRRGTKGAVLFEDSRTDPIASGQTAVTCKIEELIGKSAKDFVSFNVARQFEAANILTLGSAKLSAYMEDLCNVRLVDDAVQWLRTKISEAKEVVKMGLLIRERLDYLDEQRPALVSKVDAARRAHTENLLFRDAAQQRVTELASQVHALTAQVSEHAARMQARRTLHALLERLPDVPEPDLQQIEDVGRQLEQLRAQDALYASAMKDSRLSTRTETSFFLASVSFSVCSA